MREDSIANNSHFSVFSQVAQRDNSGDIQQVQHAAGQYGEVPLAPADPEAGDGLRGAGLLHGALNPRATLRQQRLLHWTPAPRRPDSTHLP